MTSFHLFHSMEKRVGEFRASNLSTYILSLWFSYYGVEDEFSSAGLREPALLSLRHM